MHFYLVDCIILFTALCGILALGILAKKHVLDTADHVVAGRRVGFYLGTIALFSTETATVTLVYFAEMGCVYGFTAFVARVPLIVYVFLGKTGFVFGRS